MNCAATGRPYISRESSKRVLISHQPLDLHHARTYSGIVDSICYVPDKMATLYEIFPGILPPSAIDVVKAEQDQDCDSLLRAMATIITPSSDSQQRPLASQAWWSLALATGREESLAALVPSFFGVRGLSCGA